MGILKTIPFQSFDFANVRVDEFTQIYREESGEVDETFKKFDNVIEESLVRILSEVAPLLRNVSVEYSSHRLQSID